MLGGNFLKFEYASLVSRGFPLFRKHAVSFVTGIFHQMESALKTWRQCGFDAAIMSVLKKQGFEHPTPIQAQALPAILSGRDVLGIAKTGSGKTAAFVLPMLVHIMDQPQLSKNEGPIAVIAAPTRELAEQIHKHTRIFSKPYGADKFMGL